MTEPGSIFREALKRETGCSWPEWVARLQREADSSWSHEALRAWVEEEASVPGEWAERLALQYGQLLGRVPTGVTKDAGVQLGIRRTIAAPPASVWQHLVSPEGRMLWLGTVHDFRLERGYTFRTAEGLEGKLTAVDPPRKLRLNWQPADWDKRSRLQIYVLAAGQGAAVAIHQEMLEDIYMRELMLRHWETVIEGIRTRLA